MIDDQNKADAVLTAKIQSIGTAVRDVTGETDIEVELSLTMNIAAELRRTNGQILWKNPRLQGRTSFASAGSNVVTSSSGFAQGGISGETLAGLDDREVSRGQKRQALSELIEDVSRRVYLDAVAADF